ncbi:MAG: hypothetical protein Q8P67_26445 [archaeon]|nr:hypothetical protein [archaeon]
MAPPLVSYRLPFDRVILGAGAVVACKQYWDDHPELDPSGRAERTVMSKESCQTLGRYSVGAGLAMVVTAMLPLPGVARNMLVSCAGCLSGMQRHGLWEKAGEKERCAMQDYSSARHVPSLLMEEAALGICFGASLRYNIMPLAAFLASEYVFLRALKELDKDRDFFERIPMPYLKEQPK